ncbi:MAG TPA: 50S ribosome-binding GTPase, partial [Verrucomicrobiales bacterium]|nr:50S ribosome-binding GTPase [Verrucomicrobiales bacterium]
MPANDSEKEIVLSLISHTNVGKTALARTLLRADVGEVADSAHVTIVPESYPLIRLGDYTARLWDTPGFGSNLAKLAKRIRTSSNPIGWILHQIWDRTQDRSLWCSQEAIRNVQSDADVVLYLVDASQSPATVGYVDLEIEIIEWIGKPVLVFLNQTGAPDADRDRLN